jgi:hypothetical protein
VTDPATLAAVSTPTRDLRDEVWVRVHAAHFEHLRASSDPDFAGAMAAAHADEAVAHMPIPEHRMPEGT